MKSSDPITTWYNEKIDSYKEKYYSDEPDERTARLLQHNGWQNVPYHPAVPLFLRIIDRPGNILDLGCGNGLLLKILRAESPFALVPYGVDFVEQSIEEATTEILPGYKDNFVRENIETTDFFGRVFTYILFSPAYLHPERTQNFLTTCLDRIESGGKLILYEYMDFNLLDGFRTVSDPSGTVRLGEMISDSYNHLLYFTV